MATSFEQFLAVLRNDAARRRVGLDLSAPEAARIAGDPVLARAYYDNWVSRTSAPAPSGPSYNLPAPAAYRPQPAVQPPSVAATPPQAERQWAPPPVFAAGLFYERHPALVVLWMSALFALLALGPWPYEYYSFLRWFITITAAFIMVLAVRSRVYGWLGLAIPMLVLWAPAVLIMLSRPVWAVLDIALAVALGLAGWFIAGPTYPRPDGKPRWQWWQIALLVFGVGAAAALLSTQAGGTGIDCGLFYERSGAFCY